MRVRAWAVAAGVMAGVTPGGLEGQGYRLRLDTRFQAAAYRGVALDSIAVADTVTGPGGGPYTPDGYAVNCVAQDPYCRFFRPGPAVHAAPVTATADLAAWGFGVPGLSVHATSRVAGALGGAGIWPGSDAHIQLLEGYAQYAAERMTVQLGRQEVATRFGFTGFDGARLALRPGPRGLEVAGYGGWGLARGIALPVTSPALNPLDDFQPVKRQLVAGAAAGWASSWADLRLDYLREVDPSTDYFVGERAGFSMAVRPAPGWNFAAGADYDLAAGWWGSAEAELGYAAPGGRWSAAVGVRRYRPHFDLWTIWGAFSPVPYRAAHAAGSVAATRWLRLRARGELYAFDAADVSTPLVRYETSGWRFSWGATVAPARGWTVDGGYHAEFGPGASSRGFEGGVTYAPRDRLAVDLQAATLDRPLEFRYDQSSLTLYGAGVMYRPSGRVLLELDASRCLEDRTRPDRAAFSWDQARVNARIVLLFARGADLAGLPPAVRRMPSGRATR